MTLAARRGELCALRWKHIDMVNNVVTFSRARSIDGTGETMEKDTKTHQQRRAVFDTETNAVLAEHRERWAERARSLGTVLNAEAYVFSADPLGRTAAIPDTMTQRYGRLVTDSASRRTVAE